MTDNGVPSDDFARISMDGIELEFPPGASTLAEQLTTHGYKKNEPASEALLRTLAMDGITYFDVGANWGYFAFIVAMSCEPENIVCFEPLPENLAILEHNVKRNNVDVEVVGKAVGAETGRRTFWDIGDDAEHASFASEDYYWEDDERPDLKPKELEVQTTTIDQYISNSNIRSVDILKIDVEGGEVEVLEGIDTTWDQIRGMIIEVHEKRLGDFGTSVSELVEPLRLEGYELFHIDNNGTIESIPDDPSENSLSERFHMTADTVHLLVALRPGTDIHEIFIKNQERLRHQQT